MKKNLTQLFPYLPIIGILLFWGLFFYAATLYPGGSPADINSIGYDWVHNYWCNLLSINATNGKPNPARTIAILAMIILCLSLLFFFIQFANKVVQHKTWQKVILYGGSFSMLFAVFIFTEYHDLMTTLSSVFGVFAVLGIIQALYKSELNFYKITGVFCIILLGLNNFIYYSEIGIRYLPLLQKLTLGIVLAWVGGLSWRMNKSKVLS